MILEAVATVITDAKLGVLGKTLFLHHMPETCVQGIVLREPLDGIPTDNYKPGFHNGWYQVIVRDRSHPSGRDLADKLFTLLEFYDRTFTAQGVKIIQSYSRNLPIVYPRTPDNLLEWSIRFDTQFVRL